MRSLALTALTPDKRRVGERKHSCFIFRGGMETEGWKSKEATKKGLRICVTTRQRLVEGWKV
eukprot:2631047-Rhodomonas_salina.1